MGTRNIQTPAQLRNAIGGLSPASPFTDDFSARWRALAKTEDHQPERKTVWYRTQHEHWLGWLGAYDGPGAYGRKDWSRSAKFVYNHIVNPQMLIYLAEATHIDRGLLSAAVEAALERTTMTSMSSAIRHLVPWAMVEEALLAKA